MDFKEYLNTNIDNPIEVSNTVSFYDKFDSFVSLYDTIELSNGQRLLRMQGRYDSHICFVFKDMDHFKECHKSLERVLPVYSISIWDICILFLNKTEDEKTNIDLLLKEIFIVNPSVIYVFDNVLLNKQLQNTSKNVQVLNAKMISVNNIQALLDKQVARDIFDLFEYLITFNY